MTAQDQKYSTPAVKAMLWTVSGFIWTFSTFVFIITYRTVHLLYVDLKNLYFLSRIRNEESLSDIRHSGCTSLSLELPRYFISECSVK